MACSELIGRDVEAGLSPRRCSSLAGQVCDHGLCRRRVAEGHHEVRTTLHALRSGEAEEVEVGPVLQVGELLDDLAAGEAGLLDHHGLGWVGEDLVDGVEEGGVDGAGGAADGVLGVGGPLDVGLVRLDDAWVIVGDRAVDEVHHVLGPLLDEEQVLDEVGAGPPGGGAALHAHAPGDVAVGDHLIDEGVEFVKGGRDGVAEGLKLSRAVPDDGLDIGLDRHGQPLAADGSQVKPVRGIVLGLCAKLPHILQLVGVQLCRSGGRPEQQVGRRALGFGVEDRSIAGRLGHDLHAASVDEGLEDSIDALFFGAGPLIHDAQLVPGRYSHAVNGHAGGRLCGGRSRGRSLHRGGRRLRARRQQEHQGHDERKGGKPLTLHCFLQLD